ncbi:MAG: alanine--tRNA ligase [Candidatus Sericytochromatia bacterium]|nr:alanine--tRNA ligase [Candidatus Tanganyikabacteria bacterium]
MKNLRGSDLRDKFLAFFKERAHLHLPSSSLIPRKDPTVLLTTAGMLQFKPYFMGLETAPATRITTVQKCFRTTDLDNVGHTPRHHTFFEMLGNFSFGDYFKDEVIPWAWEFLTVELAMPADRLWITVFTTDDEAEAIWRDKVGVPAGRIKRLGEDSNFWAAGPTGPCGPCSEIFFDFGPERGCGRPECGPDCDCGRFLEVWNLVFMEFNRDESGTLTPLPAKNIDTGMGLERTASVLQGVATNFDTDLFRPLMDLAAGKAGKPYGAGGKTDVSLKIIADHLRASTFLVGDGVTPSNEGRGYVLRRIIRRAVRHGRLLGISGTFLADLAAWVIDNYGGVYPELQQQRAFILDSLGAEEERFNATLDNGMQLFEKAVARHGGQTIPGEVAFELYDTYGFPFELTAELAAERGLGVDETGFHAQMNEQRERARQARERAGVTFKGASVRTAAPTRFLGYQTTTAQARVLEVVEQDDRHVVVLDQTPFYAESGGQIGDQGVIGLARVVDTQKQGDVILHYLEAGESPPAKGQTVEAAVDTARRGATMRHHTGTHLLHAALRQVLGPTATQAGSYVGPDELRFDFNFPRSLAPAELRQVEELVNSEIFRAREVRHEELPIAQAQAKGAIAMFGEKYGDVVRVVDVPGFSTELCGGTHAHNTGEIGLLKITEEKGISAGVRRIRAVCGGAALELFRRQWDVLAGLRDEFKVTTEEIPERVTRLRDQVKERDEAIRELKARAAAGRALSLLSEAREMAGLLVLAAVLPDADPDALRGAALALRDKLGDAVVVLGSAVEGKVNAVAAASPGAVGRGAHAGKLIGSVLGAMGGRGGGKPDLAQGGGGDPEKLAGALGQVPDLVSQQVSVRA